MSPGVGSEEPVRANRIDSVGGLGKNGRGGE
jgi:hypothetical protein